MKLVRVPLRISLCGGGSDLPRHYEEHRGAVVSFTIDKYIWIAAKFHVPLFPNRYRLVYSKVEECNDRSEIKHPIIRTLVDLYDIEELDLDVMSDIPAGTGMGSSSAFTVGLHAALGYTSDKHELAKSACQTEIEELYEPIGKQDQYATAFGGLNYFEFKKEGVTVNPICLTRKQRHSLDCHMTLVYVGGQRSASQQLKEQNITDHGPQLSLMARYAENMYHLLKDGNVEEIGPIIQRGWELKKSLSLNVSTPQVDTIIDTALKHGAKGGKLLGAGGAGFVLLFCPPNNRKKMLEGLKPLNLTYVPFNFDFEGCKVVYEDHN